MFRISSVRTSLSEKIQIHLTVARLQTSIKDSNQKHNRLNSDLFDLSTVDRISDDVNKPGYIHANMRSNI